VQTIFIQSPGRCGVTLRLPAGECVVSRRQVEEELKAGLSAARLAKKYAGCKAADEQEPTGVPQPSLGIVDGQESGQIITNTGSTLRARAILSWAINPFGNCAFNPIWGNQADFQIRLDP
jgi:hypothetical protein